MNIDIPANIHQLLVVEITDARQNHSMMFTYERDDAHGSWKPVFDAIPVVLGRNGLGIGLGLSSRYYENNTLPKKVEGDGRSPAGLFKLSKIFGYASQSINNKMPYIALHKDLHCIDDSDSKDYNKILPASKAYKSFEIMRRQDTLYKWGIVVEHNSKALPQRGSCIFIHIATKEKTPTAGCTAMSEKELVKIIKWLDKKKRPALLQYIKKQ